MIPTSQLAIGEVCQDETGMTVRVEHIDIYDYVYFIVIGDEDENETRGEMSHLAFNKRFSRLPRAA